MSVRTAYGARENLRAAIDAGVVPCGTVVLTKDEGERGELLFYSPDGELKTIKKKSVFGSMKEALLWMQMDDYAGEAISVLEDGVFHLYLAEQGGRLVPTESLIYIQEYGTAREFPNVGHARCLYIATKENDGRGYLYRWDGAEQKYFRPFESFEDIEVISGGNAED